MPLGEVGHQSGGSGCRADITKVHLVTEKEQTKKEERGKEPPRLDWKDYIAITIAALQTTLLPFVLLFFIILVISIAVGVFLFR